VNWHGIAAGLVVVPVLLLESCGGAGLSPLAAQGQEIAQASGCAACHGEDAEGDIGPTWHGLAGSTVELEDGRTVIADADYLRRAIVDPDAEIVAGVSIKMPVTNLSEVEVDALIAYIEELQ
jgi:cytochrome c oxidase subunit 2